MIFLGLNDILGPPTSFGYAAVLPKCEELLLELDTLRSSGTAEQNKQAVSQWDPHTLDTFLSYAATIQGLLQDCSRRSELCQPSARLQT